MLKVNTSMMTSKFFQYRYEIGHGVAPQGEALLDLFLFNTTVEIKGLLYDSSIFFVYMYRGGYKIAQTFKIKHVNLIYFIKRFN